jgi:hypothetical protein
VCGLRARVRGRPRARCSILEAAPWRVCLGGAAGSLCKHTPALRCWVSEGNHPCTHTQTTLSHLLTPTAPPHYWLACITQAAGRLQRKLAHRLLMPDQQQQQPAVDSSSQATARYGSGRFVRAHRLSPTAVALSGDGCVAFSVSKDGSILRWDVETMKRTQLVRCVGVAAVCRACLCLLLKQTPDLLRVWLVAARSLLGHLSPPAATHTPTHPNPRRPGSKAAAAAAAAEATGTNPDWVKRGPRQNATGSLLAAALSSDGKYLAVGGGDKAVHVFDAASGAHVARYPGHRDQVGGVAVCVLQGAVSRLLGVGLRVLTTHTHARATHAHAHCHTHPHTRWQITGLSFRPGTHTLNSASYDRTVKLWSLDDAAYVDTLFGHQVCACVRVAGTQLNRSACGAGGREGCRSSADTRGVSELISPREQQAVVPALTAAMRCAQHCGRREQQTASRNTTVSCVATTHPVGTPSAACVGPRRQTHNPTHHTCVCVFVCVCFETHQ